ncbi:AzlC family ABC transporter permease [Kitasatospora sp. NPDC058965]|uniref:AzlC family ABC transporter permease n=1 Tax=Kitasatospora sp. NPDC058965 TaxID=3346682 RepID=UPI00367D0D7F
MAIPSAAESGAPPTAPADRPAPPRRAADLRAALHDSRTVGLGLVPLGLAFGAYVTHAGLAWWWAGVFTTVIYAGSFEFLLVGLVTAATPVAAVAVTAFLVNVRHVFYALSFPLHRVRGRAGKAYSTFAMIDEAYALTTTAQARDWSGRRILWLQGLMQSYWVGSAVVGALLGSLIPRRVTGLDFALTALFAVLALDAVRERKDDLPTPALALLCALAARLVLPGQLLLTAFTLFTAGLLARHLVRTRRPNDA